MNEATWLIDHDNLGISLEVGYFSGHWGYGAGGWFVGLLPYYTENDGLQGWRGSSYLPANTPMYMDAVSGGFAKLSNSSTTYWYQTFSYSVPNGQNDGQGEVLQSTNTWLGNGDSNGFTGYWSPNGTSWYVWGSQTICSDSPYWDVYTSYPGEYKNGGY